MANNKDTGVPFSGRVYPEIKSEMDALIKQKKQSGVSAKNVWAEIWNVYKSVD